jgi:FkbM family methyltransferase
MMELSSLNKEDIDLIYKRLLGRKPESEVYQNFIELDLSPLDFIFNVVSSEEFKENLLQTSGVSKIRPNSKYQVNSTNYGELITDSSDLVIGKSIRQTGKFFEDDIVGVINLLKATNNSLSGSVFLDVGANIGTHSIYALKNGFDNAICVEPDYENYRLLRANQILNDVYERCYNVSLAASSDNGKALLEISPVNFGDHRIKTTENNIDNIHNELERKVRVVSTQKLDEIIEHSGHSYASVAVAWVDTQGHEGHVFAGAKNFLKTGKPITFEFWPYGLSRCNGWEILREILTESKRKLYDLRPSLSELELKEISIAELDEMYSRWVLEETKESSPHTEILMA